MMNFGKQYSDDEQSEGEDDGSTSQMKVKLLDDLIEKLESLGGEDKDEESGPDMNEDPSHDGLGISKTKLEIGTDPKDEMMLKKLKGII